MKKPKVIITRRLQDRVEKRMRELFNVDLSDAEYPISRQELLSAVKEADILVPTIGDKIDASILSAASSNLKLIANYGAGYDHIDIKTALQRGITVTNTPSVLTTDTADMTMALILAIPRKLREGHEEMQSGSWKGWSPSAMIGMRITGKKLGILGMGRIGQAIAKRAKAFDLDINYHNRRRLHQNIEESLSATYWENLEEMLSTIDILVVSASLNPSSLYLLDAKCLGRMKQSAYLVNISRGEIIDQKALVRQLKEGRLGGAGLDVYDSEEIIGSDFKSLKNVFLLPHMGSSTLEGRIEMGEKVIINIKTFIDGHRPPDQIVPSML
ncbi:MAG: D-glycerate dehydrogenase [Rhodobacterales bacterium TMED271]|nr:MAG: D-glycerate dehydrogenase [Rhodobacterales bacterium TMED271]